MVGLAKNLAADYPAQYKILGWLGDCATENIASDWVWRDLKSGILRMFNERYITDDVVDLYRKMDQEFTNYSRGGKNANEKIWTLEVLKSHPFGKAKGKTLN